MKVRLFFVWGSASAGGTGHAVEAVVLPFDGIVEDVGDDIFMGIRLADDVIVIIAFPYRAPVCFGYTYLKPPDHIAQGRAVRDVVGRGGDLDDTVQVVGHDHILMEDRLRVMGRDLLPAGIDNAPQRIEVHLVMVYVAEQRPVVMGAEGNEIECLARIIEVFQPDRMTVFFHTGGI